MTYQKQAWVSRETVVTAARMDHIETGIDEAHDLADGLDTRLTAAQEAVDELGALKPGDWVDLTLTSPWYAYDSAGTSYYPGVRARKVPAGVQIQGMVRGGSENTEIFNLPTGLTPEYGSHYPAISNGVAACVFVSKSGQFRYISGGSSTAYVSINLIIPTS